MAAIVVVCGARREAREQQPEHKRAFASGVQGIGQPRVRVGAGEGDQKDGGADVRAVGGEEVGRWVPGRARRGMQKLPLESLARE